jgi:hypothetical protein
MKLPVRVCLAAALVISLLCGLVQSAPEPLFPLQISANIEITAHQIPAESEFPPRTRRMVIYYDYLNKRGRADIEEGFEAAKTYIRRYDLKNEYMIRLPPINDCKRSYLGEKMPFPEIPEETVYVGESNIDGVPTHHYMFEDYDIRVHMYFNAKTHAPVRLHEESVEGDGIVAALLTYDYSQVELGAPDELLFELEEPHSHGTCDRHLGGFPYLHVYHYFVRF